MLEQVAEIIAKLPQGTIGITDPEWAVRRLKQAQPKAQEILNLFKAEVDKLAVIGDEVVSRHWLGWAFDEPRKYITIHDCLMAISNEQLQDIKKQLLERME